MGDHSGMLPSCRVATAILNWNGLAHLQRFLPSVIGHNAPEDRVVLIDNGSDDGSVAWVGEHHPDVVVIALDENLGFAGGYNAGLAQLEQVLEAGWYLLLNSDVEVTPGWVDKLVGACQRHGWSAAQPKIRSVDRPAEFEYAGAAGGYMDRFGFMFCAGRIFDRCEVDEGQYDEDRAVFWASGAALLVESEAWRETEGLDADFFAHMEEIDLCWRLRNRGRTVGVATGSHVFHLGGGTLGQSSPFKAELNFRNNLFLLLKNDHRPGIGRRIFTRKLLDGIAAFRFLTEGKPAFFRAVVKAHRAFGAEKRNMLAKRRSEMASVPAQASAQALTGRYAGSIIVDYYFRGRRRWSDLPQERFL